MKYYHFGDDTSTVFPAAAEGPGFTKKQLEQWLNALGEDAFDWGQSDDVYTLYAHAEGKEYLFRADDGLYFPAAEGWEFWETEKP